MINNRNLINKKKWIDKCNVKFNSMFDYTLVDYKSQSIKVVIICPIHGKFTTTPESHFTSKYGCKMCGNEKGVKRGRKTISDYVILFNKIHNHKYTYLWNESEMGLFIKYDDDFNAICPIHGDITLNIGTHSKGAGCKRCAIEYTAATRKNKSLEHFKSIDTSSSPLWTTFNGWDSNMNFTCDKHGVYSQTPNNHYTQNQGCPKCVPLKRVTQLEIAKFVGVDIIDEKMNNVEFDIISHSDNFAIEYDGLIFHSYGLSFPNNMNEINPNKHKQKTELAESLNYQLFRIWENEWLNQTSRAIWESMINSRLNRTTRIFARKCIIKEINNDTYKNFVTLNHMQGYVTAKVKLGLYYNDELISIMSFSKSRFNKTFDYELIRFCSKLNTTIVGGASKLLKYFERMHNPKNIISYANRRWSNGNLYEALGFTKLRVVAPNYFYIDKNLNIYSRHKFQKHKLVDELDVYDESLSERDNMVKNNYRILYDCGNLVYIKENICQII